MNMDSADRVLDDWLGDGPDRGPQQGLTRALAATRSVEQRHGWSFPSWWLPRSVADVAPQTRRYAVLALTILLLLLAVFAFAAGVGRQPPPNIRNLLGPAADRLVAFSDGAAISVSRLDGSAWRTLSGSVQGAHSPVFSPNGELVAFAAPALNGDGERLYVVPVDGSTEPFEVDTSFDADSSVFVGSSTIPQYSWSPDSSRIAFVANGTTSDNLTRIYIAAIYGGAIPISNQEMVNYDLPSWSPDGQWIAYRYTSEDGSHRGLELTSPDGFSGRLESIATVIAPDSSISKPRWSPNANETYDYAPETATNLKGPMAYWLNAGFETMDSALIWLGVGNAKPLWTQGLGGIPDAGPSWSPDGRWLAMLTATKGVVLAHEVLTDVDNVQLRMLGPVADCWIEWLPDGSGLYGGSPNGCTGTVVIPLDNPGGAATIPGATGIGSWQPLEP